jgi:hypothetical protein
MYQLLRLSDERYELTAFDLQSDKNSTFHFQAGWREPIGLPLNAALVTKDPDAVTEYVSPLYSAAAGAQTKRLLMGKAIAVGLYVPGGAPVRIAAGGVAKTFEPLAGESIIGAPGSTEYEQRISGELINLLRGNITELLIDAGDFGRVDVHSPETKKTPATEKRKLSPELKSRLLWLMQSATAHRGSMWISPKSVGWIKRFSTDDQLLIDQFIGIRGWPIHLQPLAGVVTRDLLRKATE